MNCIILNVWDRIVFQTYGILSDDRVHCLAHVCAIGLYSDKQAEAQTDNMNTKQRYEEALPRTLNFIVLMCLETYRISPGLGYICIYIAI